MKPSAFALRRGQTLVLFSLMLLMLVLMVALTLSTGSKVKEKMELQSVADAAAFSNATATARTFNEVALMQRGQIGQMVAMASTQSLISYTGFYRSQVDASRKAYIALMVEYGLLATACCIPTNGCLQMCKCAIKAVKDANKQRKEMVKYQKDLDKNWNTLDNAAAMQTKALQGAASTMYRVHQQGRLLNLQNLLRQQKLAGEVVKAASNGAKWSGEWSAPSAAGAWSRNMSELGVMTTPQMLKHHQGVAMGSRGFSFVTNRSGGGTRLTLALTPKLKPDVAILTDTGNAWWGPSNNHGKSLSGKFSWADDHGSATITFLRVQAPCPPLPGFSTAKKSYVKSTDIDDKSDQHVWSKGSDDKPAKDRHTLGKCIQNKEKTNCPGMWPGFLDYQKDRIKAADDLFGQPKNYAVIQRDYSTRGERADPWNLMFRFRFTPGGDVGFSNSGINLTSDGQSLNISKQTAVSTGLAYYHRPNYWKETPNFFNPYWRATLVSATIDNPGGGHLKSTLNGAGVPWAAEAWDALKKKGFKGGP